MFNKKNKSEFPNFDTLSKSITSGSSEHYSLSLSDIQEIYFNDMHTVRISDLYHSIENGQDIGINYQLNSYGYRGPEPKINNGILTLGCSQTFGIGIRDYKNTWPAIVSHKLDLSYTNLAKSGSSTDSQVRRAFAYFKKFGHPKYIFAIFPDLQRIEFPSNYKTLVPSKDEHFIKPSGLVTKHFKSLESIPKISYLPHDARDVFTEELCHFKSAQSILMLEQYCEIAGINFIWGTWSEEDEDLILKLKEINNSSYKNFIALNNYQWVRNYEAQQEEFHDKRYIDLHPNRSDCHNQYSHLEDFYIALDRKYGFSTAHSGTHRHMHWAETMLNSIK